MFSLSTRVFLFVGLPALLFGCEGPGRADQDLVRDPSTAAMADTLELPNGDEVTPEDVFLYNDYPYRLVWLDDDEYERFRELKEEFTYYKQLQEANSDPPFALGDSVARLPLNLPERADDPLAEFGELVAATAGLRDAVEHGEIEGIDDYLGRLGELLDPE